MKIDLSLPPGYRGLESGSLHLSPDLSDSWQLPEFDLLEAMPDYSLQKSLTFEARIPLLSTDDSFSLYANSKEAKQNLICPMVIAETFCDETHFTRREGWKCYQLIYTISGSGTLNLENSVYLLRPGSLFLLDCRKYHYFYNTGPEVWNYSFIHFGGGSSAYLCGEVEKNSLLFENAVSSRAVQKFNTIFELSRYDSPDFDIKFHELMTSLLSDLIFLKSGKEPSIRVPVWLGSVLEYISDNYNRQISVSSLAEMVYLSPGRFAHRFTELVGQSPIEYQYGIRIAWAKTLLETTDLPLDEICSKVGFANTANFYSRFRKSEGVPPGRYRKLKRGVTIIIRKATADDADAVASIYEKAHAAEEAGLVTTGWKRGIYPVRDTALAALGRDDLFVMEDKGIIVGTAILNKIQVDAYVNGNWKFDAAPEKVMVMHTLVIDPDNRAKGYGKKFVKFYEEYALASGCPYLRMDTNEKNNAARRLYANSGYEEIGIVPCVFNGLDGVNLVLLEKCLDRPVP